MAITQQEMDQSLETHRSEITDYFNEYMSDSVRHQEITQTIIETPEQSITVKREITYGDITISALLIMLLVYTIARQVYTDIRSGI